MTENLTDNRGISSIKIEFFFFEKPFDRQHLMCELVYYYLHISESLFLLKSHQKKKKENIPIISFPSLNDFQVGETCARHEIRRFFVHTLLHDANPWRDI